MFSLATHIPNLEILKQINLTFYNEIYLGDYTCPFTKDNFAYSYEQILRGLDFLNNSSRTAKDIKKYISFYAVPRNKDFEWLSPLLEKIQTLQIDGIEVHNMGLLYLINKMNLSIPLHIGIFGNIYTLEAINLFSKLGVQRVFPNPELSLEEIFFIFENLPEDMNILLPVHGKIPLGISDKCFLKGLNKDKQCPDLCLTPHWLSHKDWYMKNTGMVTLSGKDLCMIEHLKSIISKGLRSFYVYSLAEPPDYINNIGKVYYDALTKIFSGELSVDYSKYIEIIKSNSKYGVCNGYYFKKSGREYIGLAKP